MTYLNVYNCCMHNHALFIGGKKEEQAKRVNPKKSSFERINVFFLHRKFLSCT